MISPSPSNVSLDAVMRLDSVEKEVSCVKQDLGELMVVYDDMQVSSSCHATVY